MSDTLYIDSNEPAEVQAAVKTTIQDRDTDTETQVKGLKTADFVYKDAAVERKKASDLASSIKDRRIKEQVLRMVEDFNHQYVIIESDPYNLEYSNLHDNSFIGTMVSRSVDGAKIIYTPDVKGTAYAVNKLVSKHGDGEQKKAKLERTAAETEDVQVAMLTCVKGISKEKAREILGETSIREICTHKNAGQGTEIAEKLQEIQGIGPNLSKRVVESF